MLTDKLVLLEPTLTKIEHLRKMTVFPVHQDITVQRYLALLRQRWLPARKVTIAWEESLVVIALQMVD